MPAEAKAARAPLAAAVRGQSQGTLIEWYLRLAPCWLGAKPPVRRRLLLRTHQWIAERLLGPDSDLRAAAEDLEPGGALTRTLAALVPPDQLDGWREWIQLVVADLRRALLRPLARRNEAWVQWLFLIPYSVRVSARATGAPDT